MSMRNIVLLSTLIVLSGCTISARNHHFELMEFASKKYDDFNNIWCFTANQSPSAVMCSSPYKRRSESVGIIVPMVPQSDRSSRLAYDINRERIVEFKNTDAAESIHLNALVGFEQCTNEYAKICEAHSAITIRPNSSVWLKVPAGEAHEFSITIGKNKCRAVLKEFNETRWHQVSV